MIVMFNLNPATYKAIKDLVDKGMYDSIENFVEIALSNQLQLEKQGISTTSKNKMPLASTEIDEVGKLRPTRMQLGTQTFTQSLAIPNGNVSLPTLQSKPTSKEARESPIWGQINRLVPIKFVLRLLANQIVPSGNDRIDLKRFSADVAEIATLARMHIEKKDKAKRIRGEELYVSFSQKEPGSQQRFVNFYVGKLPSGKWTDGILTGLGLATIEQTEEGAVVIGLTEEGKHLALLRSPLVDDFLIEGKQIENPFSDEEVKFLLKHLESLRPGEYEYLNSVLRFVKDGANTPTLLQGKISEYLKDRLVGVGVSAKVANTMQVGAIGRLVEMRLLRIEKDAQRSKYWVTDNGETMLRK